ncbi:hypothetical protein PICSAR11_02330 [Mycobacterium avium subsp. paratuberculosis]|nr:hypothetical protein PICSAR11_02330 [Mycobacterium avium subsp. paratuberculosis]CAG6982340.1 hypothetical protein PICSAR157_02342 [Mycobacterium avium subsp. paratuberculosis]CAG7028692.1 hypothetical protein PICSAR162_04367 [Mycobacterium avium subsp. paratuberculosis]CAG7063107.1 hypothetical protein PICSAR181_02245 [Mycobacterium avium subsp. paratuberculosis]CAG7066350.1 hypothetical protein PICSAR192_01398 [Mycobacterium avium subsp. paratuberculosis]
MRPAAAHQRLGLRGPRVTADQRRAAGLVRAQHRHLAGVRIGRPRLGQAVVGVGPHHHQAQVAQRREHRAAGADHHPRAAAQRRQPAPVPGGRAQPGRQGDHAGRVDAARHGVAQRIQVALVGDDRQHRPAGAHGLGGGLGESVGPRLAGQRLPDRPGGPRLGQRGQELGAAAVAVPAGRVDRRRHRYAGRSPGLPLHPGVPGRHRQPQHVGAGPRVAGRHRVDQPADLRRQHRLRRHHPIQPAQLALVVGVVAALQQEPVDQPAVEAHPHPHARLGVVGLLGRHQIVEFAVQVRHRQHRQHPGDGFHLDRRARTRAHGRPGPRNTLLLNRFRGITGRVAGRFAGRVAGRFATEEESRGDQDLGRRVRPPDRHRQRLVAQDEPADGDH